MAPWISATAYKCAATQSMDPWAAIKKAPQECGSDTYPTAACPDFHIGCRQKNQLTLYKKKNERNKDNEARL